MFIFAAVAGIAFATIVGTKGFGAADATGATGLAGIGAGAALATTTGATGLLDATGTTGLAGVGAGTTGLIGIGLLCDCPLGSVLWMLIVICWGCACGFTMLGIGFACGFPTLGIGFACGLKLGLVLAVFKAGFPVVRTTLAIPKLLIMVFSPIPR